MSNAKVTFAEIANRIPNSYYTNERWVVKKMRSEYTNRIAAILPIIYQKYKVQYFSNKSPMMISKIDHGKFVNWNVHVFLIGQGIDQMGKVLEKYDQGNNEKRTQKGCMPFCHSP